LEQARIGEREVLEPARLDVEHEKIGVTGMK
jgi:hypothetical protein